MKTGSHVLIKGSAVNGTAVCERATVCRTTHAMLPLPAGYVPVRFADGARLLCYASNIITTGA
jgi:hypothetical protein